MTEGSVEEGRRERDWSCTVAMDAEDRSSGGRVKRNVKMTKCCVACDE